MSRRFDVWIVTPTGNIHSRCFDEVALGLQQALVSLGYESNVVTDSAHLSGPAIVLGSHLCLGKNEPLPPQSIIYNLEQIGPDITTRIPGYIELLKRHPVWDYSALNISQLMNLGVNATLCGVGYMPALTRIKPAREDIDILFIGSVNPRRLAVFQEIEASGRKVSILYNSYGEERDQWIARAKLILNLHFYDAHIFEMVRVSYLLANRKCVVSETGLDASMEAPLRDGVVFVDYDKLAATCLFLLNDAAMRQSYADKGFAAIRALSQAPMLQHALSATALAA